MAKKTKVGAVMKQTTIEEVADDILALIRAAQLALEVKRLTPDSPTGEASELTAKKLMQTAAVLAASTCLLVGETTREALQDLLKAGAATSQGE